MNFVADESCAGPVIRALRKAGHDVVAIAEVAKGATDNRFEQIREDVVGATQERHLSMQLRVANKRSRLWLRPVRFPTACSARPKRLPHA